MNSSSSSAPLAYLQLLLRRGQLAAAEAYCRELLDAEPPLYSVCPYLFQLLNGQRRFTELLSLTQQLAAQQPDLIIVWQAQLICLRQLQRHDDAIAINAALLQRLPKAAELWLLQGILLKDQGQTAAALQHLQQAIAVNPCLFEAYWLRADLLKSPSETEIEQMQHVLQYCRSDSERAQVHYALARALEYQQQYTASFTQLELGATAKKRCMAYDHQSELVEYQAILQQFAKPLPQAKSQGATCTPVFICGLPRSGTTLVEQILSSHPDVSAGDELFELAQATEMVLSAEQKALRFPHWVNTADTGQWQLLGQTYLQLTARLQNKRYFTDKMPLNFKAIGIIKAALPQAKIIYCQRQPLDTLFSCYKQLFADGIAFSYDLNQLADIFIAQQQLMTHWFRLFPGQIYTVTYEQLVQQQQQQTKTLLDFLDLPWSDNCMQFYNSQRAVYTVSNSQVRQPMYHSAIGHWQHYQPQLQPLIARLKPYIEQYQAILCSKN